LLSHLFQVEQNPDFPNVTTVRLEVTSPQWEQWFLLRSDAHHDNAHCNQGLEKRHLEEATDKGAGILDFGDLFCAMQGQWDKRKDQSALIPALQVSDYFDALVDYCADFYTPHAANFVHLSPGNHEGSVFGRHQTDLTRRLAKQLHLQGSPVKTGAYAGWVRFMCAVTSTRRASVKLRYTHGYGGGGPVTKDTIQANRQMVYTDADILVSGHTHDSWHMTYVREALGDDGRTRLKETECIKCPGYKDEYSSGHGWAVGKGLPPKPQGAWWLRFHVQDGTIAYELRRAK
jgi:hypothetical protein